jgi:hypothetical protein
MVMKNRYVKPDKNIFVNNGLHSQSNLVDLSGRKLYIQPFPPLIEQPLLITQTPLLPSKVLPMPGVLPNSAILGSSCNCPGSHSNSFSGVVSSASNLVNLARGAAALLSTLATLGLVPAGMQHLIPSPAPVHYVYADVGAKRCHISEIKCIHKRKSPGGEDEGFIPNRARLEDLGVTERDDLGQDWKKIKYKNNVHWVYAGFIRQN